MARVNTISNSFTCHPHVYSQMELATPVFTFQPYSTSQPVGRYSFPIPLWVGGWVGLSGWLHTETVHPRNETVTHRSTNRARRRVTSLIRPATLPLRHADTRQSWQVNFMWLLRLITTLPYCNVDGIKKLNHKKNVYSWSSRADSDGVLNVTYRA